MADIPEYNISQIWLMWCKDGRCYEFQQWSFWLWPGKVSQTLHKSVRSMSNPRQSESLCYLSSFQGSWNLWKKTLQFCFLDDIGIVCIAVVYLLLKVNWKSAGVIAYYGENIYISYISICHDILH